MSTYTIHSTDKEYTSPLAGNGEIVTRFGPTGYHNGEATEAAQGSRLIVWAGRRMNTPTCALIRFGKVERMLKIDDQTTGDDEWSQSLDYDNGVIVSTLHHGQIEERTCSLVCLTENLIIFRTKLVNNGPAPVRIEFACDYTIPDKIDQSLNFPAMTHFDWDAERTVSTADTIQLNVVRRDADFSVQYHINRQLGEVRVQSFPACAISAETNGGKFTHQVTLAGGEQHEIWTWVMLSDRRKFSHFPDFARLQTLVDEHLRGWSDFWATSHVEFDDQRLTDLRQSALYGIRCNASPWSIPPNYAPEFWEGRTFHDELYPFLGLLSGGYVDLARRIPTFRLMTLPVALARGGGGAARFPWETIETGEEGSPFGHWNDERLHIGQFAETAWRYCLYQGDEDEICRFYPLLRGCAEMFVQDVLVRDEHGTLKTRRVTDFDEHIFPVSNGIFTVSAAIRTLESAAHAAERLGLDRRRSREWKSMASELRHSVPGNGHYTVADDADPEHWHIAQVGPIYPFAIDVDSPTAHETISLMHEALKTDRNLKAGTPPGYSGTHWMWATAMLATAYLLQGRGDEGYMLLTQVLNSVGPFLSPNEQYHEEHPLPLIPWFTTSSGAILFAMHSLFVQVDENGTTLLNGVGERLQNVRFQGLLATEGVRVSGEIRDGQLVCLVAHAPAMMDWGFHLPLAIANACGVLGESSRTNYIYIPVTLQLGDTLILGEIE